MSMFRSPNDDSSSDPGSSYDEHDVQGSSLDGSLPGPVPEGDVRGSPAMPLQRGETASESIPGIDNTWESTDWLPNTAEEHATLLTSSLLEFAYSVKAAERLNQAHGTTKFHRNSPEARALGAMMYKGASEVLVSTGIIVDFVHEDHWKDLRQQYIMGLDNLGFQAFNESMSQQVPPSPSKVLTRRTLRPRPDFGNILRSAHLPGRFTNINQHQEMLFGMVRSLALPSAHAGLQLPPPPPSAASGNRYQAEFWELERLGKGGFGTVYRVKNLLDNQDYAIKKIPLTANRLKKWQKNGAKEIGALLNEIRTSARLEHCNVVRYYGAWIEGVGGLSTAISPRTMSHRLRLKEKPDPSSGPHPPNKQSLERPSREWPDDGSHNVVFGKDSLQQSVDLRNAKNDDSMGIVFGEDSCALSQTYDSSAREPQILAQESQVQQRPHDQTSSAASLSNGTDIFTDGEGEVRSRELTNGDTSEHPIMVLHIQMSLHPLSLSTYLAYSSDPPNPTNPRHCFHLAPSLRLIRAILSGVQHLHSQGIIHRDIKPANIFLSQHGEYDQRPGCVEVTCTACPPPPIKTKRYLNPRIGDFGLAADISGLNDDEGEKTTGAGPSSRFTSKAVVGTEFYRPPRQHSTPRQQPVDEKLDVFALGILLFELLWKMETKMERGMVLSDLSGKAMLPEGFVRKIDDDAAAAAAAGGDAPGSVTVGECVEDCIRNMVCASPAQRWGCRRVSERLDEAIKML